MPDYPYPPDDSSFGVTIMTSIRSLSDGNTSGVCHIFGSQSKGFLIHKSAAADLLSWEAVKLGEPFDAFLRYPEATTGNIVLYELADKGVLPDNPSKKALTAAVRAIFAQFPDYAKTQNLTPPRTKAPTKNKGTPPRTPTR